jgi:uncharacterized damage-inducible protein DinB
MTQRTETLAAAFEQAAGTLLAATEGLSDAAWGIAPRGEARTAGQIAYHMAEVYHNVASFMQMAVVGQPLPPLTMERIHGANAEQAARYAGASRAGALDLLRQNSAAAAALVRTLSDVQLDTRTEFLGHPLTVEDLVRHALVGHTEEHLASIRAAGVST